MPSASQPLENCFTGGWTGLKHIVMVGWVPEFGTVVVQKVPLVGRMPKGMDDTLSGMDVYVDLPNCSSQRELKGPTPLGVVPKLSYKLGFQISGGVCCLECWSQQVGGCE